MILLIRDIWRCMICDMMLQERWTGNHRTASSNPVLKDNTAVSSGRTILGVATRRTFLELSVSKLYIEKKVQWKIQDSLGPLIDVESLVIPLLWRALITQCSWAIQKTWELRDLKLSGSVGQWIPRLLCYCAINLLHNYSYSYSLQLKVQSKSIQRFSPINFN